MQDHEENTEAICSERNENIETSASDNIDDEYDPEDPNHEEDTEAFCPECNENFDTSAFDYVDDEFDPENPMCPDCKREKRIAGATCENCDGRPAAHEVEMGFLCDDCFEHYADGYFRG